MSSNINYTQNNTKKELLNILSNLKKTQIVDMINQYNQNQDQNQMKKVINKKNTNLLNVQYQQKQKINNQKKQKEKQNKKQKQKENKSSIEVTKQFIHIPEELDAIEFKKSKANNYQYKNI